MTEAYANPARVGAPSERPLRPALRRGLMGKCPRCGEGKMFRAYLKVVDKCPVCGEDLSHQRADDAPAYLTILLVGHFVIAGLLFEDNLYPTMNMALIGILWSLIAIGSSLLLLPRIKGALVAYQWAMRMHGFGGPEKEFVRVEP